MELSKKMLCARCKEITKVILVRDITHAGASNVYWFCSVCKSNASGSAIWIKHDPIIKHGIDIEDIPINKDGRYEICVICGELGAEYHHWAPRHLFGDEADNWPGAYLCKPHHNQWHNTVTPDMYKGKG